MELDEVTKAMFDAVQKEHKLIKREELEDRVKILTGGGQYHIKTDTKQFFQRVKKEDVEKVLEHLLAEIKKKTNLEDEVFATIRVGVTCAQGYGMVRTDIGAKDQLRGSIVKIISKWDKDKKHLFLAGAYFGIDHHLGFWKTVIDRPERGAILGAIEQACGFNLIVAVSNVLLFNLVNQESLEPLKPIEW